MPSRKTLSPKSLRFISLMKTLPYELSNEILSVADIKRTLKRSRTAYAREFKKIFQKIKKVIKAGLKTDKAAEEYIDDDDIRPTIIWLIKNKKIKASDTSREIDRILTENLIIPYKPTLLTRYTIHRSQVRSRSPSRSRSRSSKSSR